MIGNLKPYPAMKDSGVEWLGDVPEHWGVLPNRVLFEEIKDRNCPDEQMLSVTIKKGVIRQAALLEGSSKKDSSNLDRSNYKLVQPGDIAYNKMRAWQGAVGVSDYRGIISPAYVVQRPRNGADSIYFHHLLRTPGFAKEAERWSYGITSDMWSLRPEHFKLIYACLPLLPEQAAIVRYLDYVDRRVRRYVRVKRKLIGLLEEQKQAIIHQAVTRGLDPNVPLKPSGVQWLGDLPEHWEVRRLQTLLAPLIPLTYGILLPGPRLDDGVPYLGAGDVRKNRMKIDLLPRTTPEIAAAYPRTKMRAGELVYAIRGSFGNVEVITYELEGVNLSRDAARLAPKPGIEPHWLAFTLKSSVSQEQFKDKEIGATITGVNIRDLKRVVLPIPPTDEQVAIVDYLEAATADIQAAIDHANREIELLLEYRTRLIADVVTGKLDVREAVASLPEEPDEPEPLDEADDLINADEEPADDLDTIPEED